LPLTLSISKKRWNPDLGRIGCFLFAPKTPRLSRMFLEPWNLLKLLSYPSPTSTIRPSTDWFHLLKTLDW
jgi:hypothetical protein